MATKLTDAEVRRLAPPAKGNKITYDKDVAGFGARVTAGGGRSFVLNYRAAGRERRITIGSFPDWSVSGARERARELKREVDVGHDPMAERDRARTAQTMGELCDAFESDYLPRRRPSTAADYRSLMKLYIRPRWSSIKVEAIRHADVAALHRELAKRAPYRANRLVALLSVMMSVAIKQGIRSDNPAAGIEKAHEEKRERFLSPAEIARLAGALAEHPERSTANAIKLLLLTGARRGEVLSATWGQFDIAAGVWTKPSAHTKQKREHRVPLSAPALALLADMRAQAEGDYLFPGRDGGHLQEVKRSWASVCGAADLTNVRLHDLRHSFASILASGGLSLPVIGQLLGHSQPRTTARYAHLYDDVLRAATERVGAVVTAGTKPPAELVELPGRRVR